MKKTRARVHTPVTRHIKRQRRRHRDLSKNAQDPIIKTNWDNRKTIRQNISALRLNQFSAKLAEKYTPSHRRSELKMSI